MKTNVRLSHLGLLIPVFIIFSSIFFTDCKGKAEIHDIIDSVVNCEPPFVVYFFAEAEHRTKDLEYTWEFGDGETSNDQEPVHTYDEFGKYNVNLQIRQNEAIDNFSFVLDLTEEATAPSAEWNYDIDAPDYWAPCLLSFQNTSRHATAFLWDFDDGTFSTDVAPDHEFETEGTYNVMLNAICQQDTSKLTLPIVIKAPPSQLFVNDVTISLPDNYLGSDVWVSIWYDGIKEDDSSVATAVSSFPVTFVFDRGIYNFAGFNSDLLEFELWSSDQAGSPLKIFGKESRLLQLEYYPTIIGQDDGYEYIYEALLEYRD